MSRSIYLAVSVLVIVGCVFAFFYWETPLLLQYVWIAQQDHRLSLIHWLLTCLDTGNLNPGPVILIFLSSLISGLMVAPFLIPIALRPFVAPLGWSQFR